MVELAEVVDLRLLLVADLLDGDERASQPAAEHGALRTRPQPLQLTNLLKGDAPVLVTHCR